ncbi:MAG: rhodanese-like domain-containing protein [Actinomycetota bacterium]|nr:rhodanese-like domain-containing protein [Actinomycetota bacterium]
MPVVATVRELSLDDGLDHLGVGGAAFIDLRPVTAYLESHIPGSLALVYEFGPGLSGRARDCLPLNLRLMLLDPGDVDIGNAAAALRGKGFTVVGSVPGALEAWPETRGALGSTETVGGDGTPSGQVLDVGDPGAAAPQDAMSIPVERLYQRAGELEGVSPVTVAAGHGVRAALAVGVLEQHQVEKIQLWWTRG